MGVVIVEGEGQFGVNAGVPLYPMGTFFRGCATATHYSQLTLKKDLLVFKLFTKLLSTMGKISYVDKLQMRILREQVFDAKTIVEK